MIVLDFDFTPQDQAELLKYFEGDHVSPDAFTWEVPHGTLKFVVDSVDFSNYHMSSGRTSLVEFAVSFKSCLARAGADVRCLVFHLDYGVELEVYRFSPQTYTLRDRHEHRIEIDAQTLQDAVHQFCLRLYDEVIVPNYFMLECLNYDGSGPLLDEWMKVLLSPVSEIDAATARHFIEHPVET